MKKAILNLIRKKPMSPLTLKQEIEAILMQMLIDGDIILDSNRKLKVK